MGKEKLIEYTVCFFSRGIGGKSREHDNRRQRSGQKAIDAVSMLYQQDCSMNHVLWSRLGDKYTSVRSNIQDRTHCW